MTNRSLLITIFVLLLASAIAHAQFLPYREFLFTKQPTNAYFDSLGMKRSHGVYEGEVTGGTPPVKEALMRARTRSTFARYPLYENRMWFDIEYLSTDEFLVGRRQAVANAESLAKYIGWAKNEAPALQVGLYSLVPVADPYITLHLSQRQAANDAIQVLTDSLEFICPSIYLYYSESVKSYASYAVPMVAEARRIAKGKKVFAFIAPGYHTSGSLPDQYASYEVWKNVLHVIKDSAKADGFIMFAGLNALGSQYSDWPRADTSGWWKATKQFLGSLRPDSGMVPPPVVVAPGPNGLVDPTSFEVRWTKVPGAVGYHMQLTDEGNTQQLLINDSTRTDTTMLVTGLLDSASYNVRVRALSGFAFWSDFGSPVVFKTAIPPPAPPVLVSPVPGSRISTTSLVVRWQKVHGAAKYHLQLADNVGFGNTLVNDSTLTDTVRQVVNLRTSTTYFLRLRTRGIAHWSSFADIVPFWTSDVLMNVVSAEKPAASYLAQNFPNPFNPVTTIRFALKQPSEVRLEIYNTLGELVRPLINTFMPEGVFDFRFDATGLPSGLYLCRIRAADLVDTKRLLLLK